MDNHCGYPIREKGGLGYSFRAFEYQAIENCYSNIFNNFFVLSKNTVKQLLQAERYLWKAKLHRANKEIVQTIAVKIQ